MTEAHLETDYRSTSSGTTSPNRARSTPARSAALSAATKFVYTLPSDEEDEVMTSEAESGRLGSALTTLLIFRSCFHQIRPTPTNFAKKRNSSRNNLATTQSLARQAADEIPAAFGKKSTQLTTIKTKPSKEVNVLAKQFDEAITNAILAGSR